MWYNARAIAGNKKSERTQLVDTSIPWIFVTSLLVGYSGAMMPGPLSTMSIGESAKRGWKAAPLLVTGHSITEFVMVLALMLGLSQVLGDVRVRGTVGVMGGAFLVWMGIDLLRSARKQQIELKAHDHPGSLGRALVSTGALVSVSNPYWLLWWATVGANYVVLSLQQGIAGLMAFYVGHILSDYTWNGFLGALVVSGRKLLTNAVYQSITMVCGLGVMALGGYFFASGTLMWLPLLSS